jgi:mono/diheme cytochrome c family protein
MRTMAILVLCLGIAGSAAVGSLTQRAPAKAVQRQNPFDSNEAAQRAGQKLYARDCASCHGDRGQGRRHAPPLDRADIQNAAPGALFWVLTNGSRYRGMPSFAHLPEAQRWQLVAFLRTKSGGADSASATR